MSRYEGWMDLVYNTEEAAGVNLANALWPVLTTATLALPGLFYSYWMGPNPAGRKPDMLQNIFSTLASPVLFIYNRLPSLPYIPVFSEALSALKWAIRYAAPQYIIHSMFGPKFRQIADNSWEVRGKAFIRGAFTEEFSSWYRSTFSDGELHIRDFVPAQQVNPGSISKFLMTVVGTPFNVIKGITYDFPRSKGLFSRFGIEPKSGAEADAAWWYNYGKSYAPTFRSALDFGQSLWGLAYDLSGTFIEYSLAPYKLLPYSEKIAHYIASQGGLMQIGKDSFMSYMETADDLAGRLENISYNKVSKDTFLMAEHAASASIIGGSLYLLGKGLNKLGVTFNAAGTKVAQHIPGIRSLVIHNQNQQVAPQADPAVNQRLDQLAALLQQGAQAAPQAALQAAQLGQRQAQMSAHDRDRLLQLQGQMLQMLMAQQMQAQLPAQAAPQPAAVAVNNPNPFVNNPNP